MYTYKYLRPRMVVPMVVVMVVGRVRLRRARVRRHGARRLHGDKASKLMSTWRYRRVQAVWHINSRAHLPHVHQWSLLAALG